MTGIGRSIGRSNGRAWKDASEDVDVSGYLKFQEGWIDSDSVWNKAEDGSKVEKWFNIVNGNIIYKYLPPPVITVQPVNQTVDEGVGATFTVTATGPAPITYQWQVNEGVSWANIGSATSSIYTIGATTFAQNTYQYRCVATNAGGSATSNAATLTVIEVIAPTITTHPTTQSVDEGDPVTFTVVATGYPAPTYQWQVNEGVSWANIGSATSSSYTIASTTLAQDTYQYRCVATNAGGSATSNAATLTVSAAAVAPTITSQPTNQGVNDGEAATFTVVATGDPTLLYRWQILYLGDTWKYIDEMSLPTISGYNTASLTIDPAAVSDDSTQFRCVVNNDHGSVTSSVVTLSVAASSDCDCMSLEYQNGAFIQTPPSTIEPYDENVEPTSLDGCTMVFTNGTTTITLAHVAGDLYSVEYHTTGVTPALTLVGTATLTCDSPVPGVFWLSGNTTLGGPAPEPSKYIVF